MKNINLKKLGTVYCLIDPFSREVRYVGLTTNLISSRISQHKYVATTLKSISSKVAIWYRDCLNKGLEPLSKILEENIPQNKWAEREDYWISKFNNLTNKREGGCGIIIDRSTDSIKKSSNSKKIQITQLTIDGELIKIWDSATDAANNLNLRKEVIGRVCNHKYNVYQTGSFRWAYYDDYINGNIPIFKTMSEVQKESNKNKKTCFLFCAYTKNFIRTFRSTINCAKYLNYKFPSGIQGIISNKGLAKYLYYISYSNNISDYGNQTLYYWGNEYWINPNHLYKYKVNKNRITQEGFAKKVYKGDFPQIKVITKFNEDIVRSLKETLGKYPM